VIPCNSFTIEIGPLLSVLLLQAVTLAGVAVAGYNARRAAAQSDRVAHSQGHLRASIENLGATDPALHKE
jgi:hypothetical protein